MEFDTKENIPYWLNEDPKYNRAICSKLHGTMFDYFIRNTRTDRSKFRWSIIAHDKQNPIYVDNSISGCAR